MSSGNDCCVTIIETPVAQGPRGLTGPQGPRGPSGDEPDISPDEGNQIQQRPNGIYSPPVELPEYPQSAVEDIDDAVSKKHDHSNSDVLNGFSLEGDQLHHNGRPVVQLGELPSKVSTLESEQQLIEGRVTSVEDEASSNTDSISTLQVAVGHLQTAVVSLETDMGNVSLVLDEILGEP